MASDLDDEAWIQSASRHIATTLETIDAPGAILAVADGDRIHVEAFGFADDARGPAMRAEDRLRLGSVTKLYLAGVVLQLVDEGVLDLDDPISQYVDGVPNGDRITLRMLGRHTSGLDDTIRQMPFHARLAAEPGRKWAARELLNVAFEPGPRFEPGERWAYSNANSVLLGLAIEQATGKTWREHVRERVLEPLQLNDTGFDEPPTVRGYRYGKTEDPVGYGGVDDHRWFDATDWSASWGGAAGEMTGTARDTARYLQALFAGDLLSDEARAELTDFADTGDGAFFYGFHCHRIDAPVPAIGHHGDMPGFSSSAVWLPRSQTAVVVLTNLSAELDKWSSAIKLMTAALADLDPPSDPVTEGDLERKLRQAFDASTIRGAQAALVEDGKPSEWQLGDADKRFRAGSVSKLLTSLLVLRAQEAGVLNLDDPVEQYLPGVLGDQPGAGDVTIAQLLEHTAGLPGSSPREYAANTPGLLPSTYVEERHPFALRWRPGLHYSYSNPGYTIAAAAVERAWGADFDTLMQREVFEPLGMDKSTFDADSPSSFEADGVTPAEPWDMPIRPAGSAVTTASDLAQVVAMLLDDGGDFLSPESVARLERGETGILAQADGGAGSYGLGTFAYVAGEHVLRAHWGKTEGFRATLAYTPDGDAGAGYVLLVDTADSRGIHELRSILNGHVTRELDVPSGPAPIGELPAAFAGLYVNASHDVQERAWLFSLLDVRRLSPEPDGVRVTPLFFGPPWTWQRIGDNLYQADGLPVASGATWQADEGRYWVDGESYRRVPAWFLYGQFTVLTLGLAASVLAIATWPIVMIARIFRRRRLATAATPPASQGSEESPSAQAVHPPAGLWPHTLAIAGIALLVLLTGFVQYQLTTVSELGRVGVVSMTLLATSVIAPLAVALSLVSLIRGFTRSGRRLRLAWGGVIACSLTAMSVLLMAYGLIPFWP